MAAWHQVCDTVCAGVVANCHHRWAGPWQLHNNYLPLHLMDVCIVLLPTILTFWISRVSHEVGIPDVNELGLDTLDPMVAEVEGTTSILTLSLPGAPWCVLLLAVVSFTIGLGHPQ